MKYLILLVLLISFSSFAEYMSETDLEDCDLVGRQSYTTKSKCESSEGASCYKVVKGYNCAYDRVKSSKSEAESCVDDADCQDKLAAKICLDKKEHAIKVLTSDPKEVYCTRTGSMEDAALKTAHDSDKASKVAAALVLKNKRAAAKALILKLDGGSDLTPAELRKMLAALGKSCLRD